MAPQTTACLSQTNACARPLPRFQSAGMPAAVAPAKDRWQRRWPAQRSRVVTTAGQGTDLDTKTIDDLNTSFCNDFVCTSSPSVEAGVRAAAKIIERANSKWGSSRVAQGVEYQDPVRRFKGAQGYTRLDFIPTNVSEATVTVTRMAMRDNAQAVIDWRLTGKVAGQPVDVRGSTTLTLNLLTGRIERHQEEWDLSASPLPGRLAWTAAAAAWAARQASADAADGTNRVLDSLTSFDQDDAVQPPNPNDPMKFFQQRDTSKQDAITFMAVVALFWALAKAYGSLQGF